MCTIHLHNLLMSAGPLDSTIERRVTPARRSWLAATMFLFAFVLALGWGTSGAAAEAIRECPFGATVVDLVAERQAGHDENDFYTVIGAQDIEQVFPDGIPFGGQRYHEMYVTSNGLVTFDNDGETIHCDDDPSDAPWKRGVSTIAVFYADIDFRDRVGTPREDNPGALELCVVEDAYILITWRDVMPYDTTKDYARFNGAHNTFQLVMTPLRYSSNECEDTTEPRRLLRLEFLYEQLGWQYSGAQCQGQVSPMPEDCELAIAGYGATVGDAVEIPVGGSASHDIQWSVCGDSFIEGCEQCDGTDCSATCSLCGNGVVEPGEFCDPLYDERCEASCQAYIETCGNGVIEPEFEEECDPAHPDWQTIDSDVFCDNECFICRPAGGGCSATGGSLSLGALVLLLGVFALGLPRRRARHLLMALVAALALAASATTASAQDSFSLGDEIADTDHEGVATPLEHGSLRFASWVGYSANPVVMLRSTDDERVGVVVAERATAGISAAFGVLGWLELDLELPFVIHQVTGDMAAAMNADVGSSGAGDLYLGAKVKLLEQTRHGVALAMRTVVSAPTGTDNILASDRGPSAYLGAALAHSIGERCQAALTSGVRLRERTNWMGLVAGNQVEGSALVGCRPSRDIDLTVHAGADFATTLNGGEFPTAGRVNLGVEKAITESWRVGVNSSAGIGHRVGNSDWAVGSYLAFLLPGEKSVDTDGDGYIDPEDGCPLEPEDFDGFEDADGCPDPDNDQDAILDVDDACPLEPEDYDGFEDADGCPDPDNDQDRILDVDDTCPNHPEDYDGYQDEDGCPDTIPCLEGIHFEHDKAELQSRSLPIMERVSGMLSEHREYTRIVVEGHTSLVGTDEYNLDLSRRRARTVVDYLVAHGVGDYRLTPRGEGERYPVSDNPAENRRVEFKLYDADGALAATTRCSSW